MVVVTDNPKQKKIKKSLEITVNEHEKIIEKDPIEIKASVQDAIENRYF